MSMKFCTFIRGFQDLSTYLDEFSLDTQGQDTVQLCTEIDNIHHAMPITQTEEQDDQTKLQ